MDSDSNSPVVLPEGFNHELGIPSHVEEAGVYHATYMAARFAYKLAANGTPEDLVILERSIDTLTQRCQELNPEDPHYGNFRWELEDTVVEDLNAVHFAMIQLIPIGLRYKHLLSAKSYNQIIYATQLALAEIERIDVGLDYTNICLKDIINTTLGGQLIGDASAIRRGKEKLWNWLEFTYGSGGGTEINGPVYTNLVLEVMVLLAELCRDPEVASLSRLISARMGLVYALRILPDTGRLAGPFCRCYRPQLLGQAGPEVEFIKRAMDNRELPKWMDTAIGSIQRPGGLLEGYDANSGLYYATHLSDSYSFGVASRELITQENRYIAGQSNVFTMNFKSPESRMGGLVFTRYSMDENWVGDFQPNPGRTASHFLLDEGRFLGAANGSKAIGVYSPKFMGAWEARSAAKMVFVISHSEYVREILVNGEAVESIPCRIPEKALVCFGFEETFLAIRLFERTDLGVDSPIQLCERDGELLLEVYNYKGARKTFWELAQPGSFYRGQPQCAFYAEAAERSGYTSIQAFSKKIEQGQFRDDCEPAPGHRTRNTARRWDLEYSRGGESLGISIDLMNWELLRRWNEKGELTFPLLESPVARQTAGGTLAVEDVSLDCGSARMWIYNNRKADLVVLGGIANEAADLKLKLPGKSITVRNFRYGLIKVEAGELVLDTNPEVALER